MSSEPAFDIVRAAHIEFNVTNLKRSREFYVKTLGLIETDATSKQLYLRGVEDRFNHCLVLTEANKPSVGHLSFRVRSESDLDSL
ncbi:MAG TPA: VOC family protein, partial [Nitrososphaerales archaeon]|nr:VOC family protein [Nitrososphaerales archaeon]